jgi:hypothetical protein
MSLHNEEAIAIYSSKLGIAIEGIDNGCQSELWLYVARSYPYREADQMHLASVDFRCAIADIYEDVDFPVTNQ